MNPDKLKKLQAEVRIGGKGTQRRKKKVVHVTAAADDKKLQQSLKKLSLNQTNGIEEVNIIRTDGTVINIKNPKTQAAVSINTFAITGNGIERTVHDMLPGILPQLGPRDLQLLHQKTQPTCKKPKKVGATAAGDGDKDATKEEETAVEADSDDDVPNLVEDFEATAQKA